MIISVIVQRYKKISKTTKYTYRLLIVFLMSGNDSGIGEKSRRGLLYG